MKYSDIGGIVVSQFLAKGLDRGLRPLESRISPQASPTVSPTLAVIVKGLTTVEGVEEALIQYFKLQIGASNAQ